MKCICCERNIVRPYDKEISEEDYIWSIRSYGKDNSQKERAENRMWIDGLVANVSAGYGSTLDGNMYVIAICDECTKKKHQEGIIAYTGDYIINDKEFNEEMIEESKKLWRRDQNLDKLT